MSGGAPEIRGLDWFSGGPVGWYFLFIYVAAVLLAVFVVADCLRPKRAHGLAELPEPRWIYLGFQAAFLAFALFGWVPPLPRWVAVIPVADDALRARRAGRLPAASGVPQGVTRPCRGPR